MKAFVSALVALVVIGTGAWAYLTRELDYSSASVYTSQTAGAVRLSPDSGKRPGK
ncbi:hypothetical protein [Stappia sp. TSB10P1A]|uniref:hypothetical protein n=1 Tax=Stappia sp. TSB10P1A TaxID=2003585 RepID=UPI00164399C3|nr:hypothetical protein [Stappia sp. TSB10P1A]